MTVWQSVSVSVCLLIKKNKEKFIVILIAQQFNKNQKQNAIVYMYLFGNVCMWVCVNAYVCVCVNKIQLNHLFGAEIPILISITFFKFHVFWNICWYFYLCLNCLAMSSLPLYIVPLYYCVKNIFIIDSFYIFFIKRGKKNNFYKKEVKLHSIWSNF